MVFKLLFHNLGSAVTILFVCRTAHFARRSALPVCVYDKYICLERDNHCNVTSKSLQYWNRWNGAPRFMYESVSKHPFFKKENTNLYQNSRNYRHYKQHFINPYKSWSLWFKRSRQIFFILIYRALFQGNFHQNKMTCNKWSPTLVPVYTCTL